MSAYFVGYTRGIENVLANKISDVSVKIANGVHAVEEFPAKFNAKVDGVMEEVKSWFTWKRGEHGEIILDESSPLFGEVDRKLREAEETSEQKAPQK